MTARTACVAILITLKTLCGGQLVEKPKIRPHPRVQIDQNVLAQIRSLRDSGDPAWNKFNKWINGKPKGPEGALITSYLLAHLVTGEKQYFDSAWAIAEPKLHSSLIDLYKGDKHKAGFIGGVLISQMALMYDWGYDSLSADQKRDLIKWLNAALAFEYLENHGSHAYFRNDGASVTYGIASAVYATLGENPEGGKVLGWFHDTWNETVKALDIIGKGGASGEGNAYGSAPTAAGLIRAANVVYYASGEDLFLSHPWFKQRLLYDAFAAYPGTVTGTNGPMIEEASIGGDGRRGASWHSASLRPNGLILSRRFAGTEEANTWNWVYRQPAVDYMHDPSESFCDLLYYSPKPKLVKPVKLSFFDPSMGFVYIRSNWDSPDATWISSWAGPHIDTHQHLDQGAFTVFKRRDLAPKTGHYDNDNVKSAHDLAYYTRTVSSNGILVGDPNEIFRGFIAGMGCDAKGKGDLFDGLCVPNDGGQRTMLPLSLAAKDAGFFAENRATFDVAKVVSFKDDGKAVSWVADITNAYSKKVTKLYRRFVYLREPDILVIGDTVESAKPEFEKKWLLHALDQLEVGKDEAKITVESNCDLRSGYAALLIKTLFPVEFRYTKVGGRKAQDFWVKDYNEGVIPNHKSFNWAPVKPIETYNEAYIPIFGQGYGKWRLEIQPAAPNKTDYFLNVLKPTLNSNEKLPSIRRIETPDTFGAELVGYQVVFSKNSLDAPRVEKKSGGAKAL